ITGKYINNLLYTEKGKIISEFLLFGLILSLLCLPFIICESWSTVEGTITRSEPLEKRINTLEV
ncbi:MAG: hypothetical protein ACW99F_20110, partial [Candidatus Hodarchaeales archaeon]